MNPRPIPLAALLLLAAISCPPKPVKLDGPVRDDALRLAA